MSRREAAWKPGSITVYAAMATGILLSLILTVLGAARRDLIRMQIECAADMALDSALAEYHREMLEQYGLFFIDTSYGTGNPSLSRTGQHIRAYMETNCRPAEAFGIAGARDLTGLQVEQVRLLEAGAATDLDCGVLRYHVVQYQKDVLGLSAAEHLLGLGEELEDSGCVGEGIEARWEAAQERLKEEIAAKKRRQDPEWDGTVPETPADAVMATRGEGILGVAARGKPLSGARVSKGSLPSGRSRLEGTGLTGGRQVPDSLSDRGLLYAYILDHCGFYGALKENSALSYQVEYILHRKESDLENLKAVAGELLLIREAANAAFLFGSSMNQSARETALFLAALIGMPELAELITDVILFAWAYAESVKDIRILLSGGTVPLYKTESSWNTPFSWLITYKSHLDTWKECEDGLSYRDYLGALLFLHGAGSAVTGLADMMESDIRRTPGNGGFRMDGLVDGITAEISVRSSYGGSYQITRRYEYE